MKLRIGCVVVGFLLLSFSPASLTFAQTSTQTASALPRLVRFGGTAKDLNGSPVTGVVGITFSLYTEQTGGASLWLETQNVTADSNGHYTVLLGSTKPDGLPTDLFTSEQAHWVGVQVSGQAEQPRVLLVSAPYALKAGDAETIGGLPPSAFVLAAPVVIGSAAASSAAANAAGSVSPATALDVTTTGGTLNTIPLFSTATNIQNSILTQTAATAVNVGGKLNLPATTAATKTAGADSRSLDFVASSFDSTSGTALNQTFQWQAEPAANDTTAPSGTLNLQYGLGATKPTETGLKVSSKGIFTFATGQTFPGTGDGSVTSVATGLGLKGGPITKTGTLTIDTTVVPQLVVANTFTGNQTVNGNLGATGVVSGSGYQIGSNLFDFGSFASANAFLGFAGNTTMTGTFNTAVGGFALLFNTTGGADTAVGTEALGSNTTGLQNTAVGTEALFNNTTGRNNIAIGAGAGSTSDGSNMTGNNNTALGTFAIFSTGTLNNATAIGNQAEVTVSNAMVLGSISGVNDAGANTNVGIGTTAPTAALDVEGNNVQTLIGDPGCGKGFAGIGFVGSGGFNSCSNYALIGDSPGNVYINSSLGGTFFFRNNNGSNLMTIDTSGNVSIKGNISKGGGSFKIDHPLDPANKYLSHSFVESPDMMNIYNGVIVLDANGEAVVGLPDWFEALNRDFRYQLTPVGAPGPNLYIAEEVASNQFKIAGGKPGSKVSWQVTGIRQDAFANAHRIPTEEEKPPQEQGHYLHPELFGAPAEQAIGYHAPPVPTQPPTQAETAHVSSLK